MTGGAATTSLALAAGSLRVSPLNVAPCNSMPSIMIGSLAPLMALLASQLLFKTKLSIATPCSLALIYLRASRKVPALKRSLKFKHSLSKPPLFASFFHRFNATVLLTIEVM